jgi:copper transport protein
VAALLVVGWLLSLPTQAAAHSAFLGSTPEPGTKLQSSPARVILNFSEPLNRSLSSASLVPASGGKHPAVRSSVTGARQLTLIPTQALLRGAYQVQWRTVSTLDGHTLEGSFSFGVRVAAAGGEHTVQQSPLARDGWLRIILRVGFYASLFFFAAGLLISALLVRRGPPAGWLQPSSGPSASAAGAPGDLVARSWRRTCAAGWAAAGLGAAVVLADAADAAGGFDPDKLSSFLFSNLAGLGRVGLVVALVVAAGLAPRRGRLAAVAVVAAFAGLALSGHADSASPRALAVATDLIHLLAGAVWLGGIAQIAVAWVPRLAGIGAETRQQLTGTVLPRFGRLALPAFLVVVASGLTNALIQLGSVSALWQDAYGQVLLVKMSLVGLIALASYAHVWRLRPRLLAANPHPAAALERRHWRLLRSEPLIGLGVLAAAGVLVAFPLPPRQLRESDQAAASPSAPGFPAGQPVPRPNPQELAVADHAGPLIVAGWLRPGPARLKGRLRIYALNFRLMSPPVQLVGSGSKISRCGVSCWRFTQPVARPAVTLRVRDHGRWYSTSLPATWQAGQSATAARILGRSLSAMRALRSVAISETLSSGPGSFVGTDYLVRAPDRFAYRLNNGAQTITIGARQWSRDKPQTPWQLGAFGGTEPFSARGYLGWWSSYVANPRLLGYEPGGIADLATLQPQGSLPVWLRLRIHTGDGRLVGLRMITDGHFMTQRYLDFNRAAPVTPPSTRHGG